MTDKKIPHKAVVNIRVEVQEQLSDGRLTNLPLFKQSKLITFSGDTLGECQKKVEEFMKGLKDG